VILGSISTVITRRRCSQRRRMGANEEDAGYGTAAHARSFGNIVIV
jgi:hypothetical protein